MIEDISINNGEVKKVSKLSISAFLILMLGIIVFIIGFFNSFVSVISPLILMLAGVVSTILSIIDLTKKHRKKWLSVLTIIINSMYVLFLVGATIMAILAKSNV